MSAGHSKQDRDLLFRLNALRKSNIDLDEKQYKPVSSHSTPQPSVDPLVGGALHADISARFQALSGNNSGYTSSSSVKAKSGTPLDVPELQNEESNKTVEELLAELGPEEEWAIGRSEEEEVADLLREAKAALREQPPEDTKDAERQDERVGDDTTRMPDIDLSVFQPEPEFDPDDAEDHQPQSKDELRQSLDQEADAYLARIVDEIRHERSQQPPHGDEEDDDDPPPEYRSQAEKDINVPQTNTVPPPPATPIATQSLDLPSHYSKTPTAQPTPPPHGPPNDNDDADSLTSRFASLAFSLPSVPTTLPRTPVSLTSFPDQPEDPTGAADAEVETWCIICLADATLQCVGCDGDLYCVKCWREGHRGEEAGYEERRHRALQYVKGGKKEKEKEKKRGRREREGRFEGV